MKKKKINSYAEEKWNKEHPPESLPWLLIKSVVSIFIAIRDFQLKILERR